ncbi:MAG: c-type cytochrome [Gemmatimonadota bacterium]
MTARPGEKWAGFALLVAAFLIQTTLVYSDEPTGSLDAEALRGRELWQRNGCQVCHQVYGQGGFLGPDLTNAYSRVDTLRFASLLTVGSGQMPSFRFSSDDIADLREFLRALDRPELGRGQLRLGEAGVAAPWDRFDRAVAPLLGGGPERGWRLVRTGACVGCHQPLAASAVGAPDLSLAATRLDADELRGVLTAGRSDLGMPPSGLAGADLEDVVAFLQWLAAEREAVDSAFASIARDRTIDWGAIPWWEYR